VEIKVRIPVTKRQVAMLEARPDVMEYIRRKAAWIAADMDKKLRDDYIRELGGDP